MKTKTFLLASLAFCAWPVGRTAASVVNFSSINLAMVESGDGQNFPYTADGSTTVESLNVRLVSGSVSSLTAGYSPDATGFYVGQNNSNLSPAYFIFTLSGSEPFTITQNETLTGYETNAFTLLPSGTWTVLSSSNVNQGGSGSTISFQGATPGDGTPYGNYSIEATSQEFEFEVLNSPGLVNYGSAISLDVVPEPGSTLFLLGGGMVAWLYRLCRRKAARA